MFYNWSRFEKSAAILLKTCCCSLCTQFIVENQVKLQILVFSIACGVGGRVRLGRWICIRVWLHADEPRNDHTLQGTSGYLGNSSVFQWHNRNGKFIKMLCWFKGVPGTRKIVSRTSQQPFYLHVAKIDFFFLIQVAKERKMKYSAHHDPIHDQVLQWSFKGYWWKSENLSHSSVFKLSRKGADHFR